jgi:hypothetical protein
MDDIGTKKSLTKRFLIHTLPIVCEGACDPRYRFGVQALIAKGGRNDAREEKSCQEDREEEEVNTVRGRPGRGMDLKPPSRCGSKKKWFKSSGSERSIEGGDSNNASEEEGCEKSRA